MTLVEHYIDDLLVMHSLHQFDVIGEIQDIF